MCVFCFAEDVVDGLEDEDADEETGYIEVKGKTSISLYRNDTNIKSKAVRYEWRMYDPFFFLVDFV